MAYVAADEGMHEYRGLSHPISKGDVLVIEPSFEHSYQSGKTNLMVYNIILQPSVLEAKLEVLFNEHIEMLHRLDRLVKEFEAKPVGYRIVIKTLLIELFIFLSRSYERRIQNPMLSLGSEDEVIGHICEFIKLHHARSLSLSCNKVGFDDLSFFNKTFKKQVGFSPGSYRKKMQNPNHTEAK